MNDWLSEVNRYASEGTSKLLIGGCLQIALSMTSIFAVSVLLRRVSRHTMSSLRSRPVHRWAGVADC